MKLSEAVDYLRAVAPRTAVPIHEAVLTAPQMYYRGFAESGPGRDHRPGAGPGRARRLSTHATRRPGRR